MFSDDDRIRTCNPGVAVQSLHPFEYIVIYRNTGTRTRNLTCIYRSFFEALVAPLRGLIRRLLSPIALCSIVCDYVATVRCSFIQTPVGSATRIWYKSRSLSLPRPDDNKVTFALNPPPPQSGCDKSFVRNSDNLLADLICYARSSKTFRFAFCFKSARFDPTNKPGDQLFRLPLI